MTVDDLAVKMMTIRNIAGNACRDLETDCGGDPRNTHRNRMVLQQNFDRIKGILQEIDDDWAGKCD